LVEEQLREVRNLLEVHDMKLGVVRSTSERTLQAAVEVGLATSTSAGDAPVDEALPTGSSESDSASRAAHPPAPARSKSSLPSTIARPPRSLQLPPEEPGPMPPPPPRPTGHFVHRGSLRSGQILRKAESIVVIGDVNPGAQVISSGDVIVWGRLRGIAYAGVDGNRRSVVAALDFVPTQLRIANLTAIAPEQRRGRWLFFWRREPARRPEIARVVDERIVVEPWDEAKIGKFSNW
jgi:septum site-determining protein MinC